MLAAFTTPSNAVGTHAPRPHTSVQLAPGVDESSHEYHVELNGVVRIALGLAPIDSSGDVVCVTDNRAVADGDEEACVERERDSDVVFVTDKVAEVNGEEEDDTDNDSDGDPLGDADEDADPLGDVERLVQKALVHGHTEPRPTDGTPGT